MGVMKDSSDKSRRGEYAQIGLVGAVPALLLAGPAVGFFAGQWADGKFGTDPWLQTIGVFLGFGAAGVEIANLVKKSQAIERENEKKKEKKENQERDETENGT